MGATRCLHRVDFMMESLDRDDNRYQLPHSGDGGEDDGAIVLDRIEDETITN